MLSDISLMPRPKYCLTPLGCLEESNVQRQQADQWLPWSVGKGKGEGKRKEKGKTLFNGYRDPV